MSDPRFRPRAYTTEENAFGKALNIAWIEPNSPAQEALLAAAQLQHRYALRINKRLRNLDKSVRDYTKMTGVGYDRMTKVLRGEAVMRLEDIAVAEMLLGQILPEGDTLAVTSGDEQSALDKGVLEPRPLLNGGRGS